MQYFCIVHKFINESEAADQAYATNHQPVFIFLSCFNVKIQILNQLTAKFKPSATNGRLPNSMQHKIIGKQVIKYSESPFSAVCIAAGY